MRKGSLLICLCLLLLVGCGQQEKPIQNEGDRIIATTVALAETAAKLNIDLVGVPSTSKELPEKYKDVQEVGQAKKPNMEIVRSLQPTHILSVTSIQPEMEKAMKGSQIKTTYYDYNSVQGMQKAIIQLGETFHRENQAEKLNQVYDQKIQSIQQKITKKKKPKVLILLGVPGSYLISTEKSYLGNLVELAGGENVIQAKQQDEEFISSNTEALYKLQPDIILRASHGFSKQVKTMFDEEFQTNTVWKNFKATKSGRVYDLDESLFGITANVNADEALEMLYQMFYKEKSS